MIENQRKEAKELELGKRIVVLIGPEGSGKSTIGKLLADKSEKPYISTGDIFREMAASNDPNYGEACRAMLEEHRYLEPKLLLEIVQERFKRPDTRQGFILDGGLRTTEEAVGFQEILENAGRKMPVDVVHLRIPGWLSMERLVTGENARNRDDDTVDSVLSRLSNFYRNLGQRSSVINQNKNWHFFHVDATGAIEQSFANVCSVLG